MTAKEVSEAKEIMQFKSDLEKARHEMKMEELKYQRDSEELHHQNETTRQRIKSAEIQRSMERKSQIQRY